MRPRSLLLGAGLLLGAVVGSFGCDSDVTEVGAGGATASGGAGGSGGTPLGIVPCSNPEQVLDDQGQWTGDERCAEGYVHRVEAVMCPYDPDPTDMCASDPAGSCTTHSECSERPYGLCGLIGGGFTQTMICGCVYGCTQDSDCQSGAACLCEQGAGRCSAGSCRLDADCEGEARCVRYQHAPCGDVPSGFHYACQTPLDECITAEQCSGGEVCATHEGRATCIETCNLP